MEYIVKRKNYFTATFFRATVWPLKGRKTETLRCRVDRQLRSDLEFVARIQVIDLSDVVRIACTSYVQKFAPKGLRGHARR